jgi:hypothetical protein
MALARAVARGSLWRAAPATDEGTARAESEALAHLITGCPASQADDASFQARPEQVIVDPRSSAYDRGAGRFFEWLGVRFATTPEALVRGLWALSPTNTSPGAHRWAAFPTAFDVLRTSLKGALWPGSTLDDVFVRFAVERWLDEATKPRTAWAIPWPSAARRRASPEPISPPGASYVMVEHRGAPRGAKLRVEAQWEDYARMRWIALKLGADGAAKAELSISSLDRATNASMTIESLDEADRVLVVGVNVGSTEHPFDPDQGEWEPHGWLLTLQGE